MTANPDGSPSDVSRAHQITSPEPGWWDVAGGKLTTYRLMAEQTVDQIARHLGGTARACRTADEPLLPPDETRFSGILPPSFGRTAVEHFVRNEWARSLEDVLVRRSGWHYFYRDADMRAEQVATWMAEAAGWSPPKRHSELDAYLATSGCVAAESRLASASFSVH